VSVYVKVTAIGAAPPNFSSQVTSRALHCPITPRDVPDHKFDLMSEEPEDGAVAEAPIFLFELRKLMSDTPHRLWGRTQ